MILSPAAAHCCNGDVEQIVGRERNQRACHRQLARNPVASRRVNSTVGLLPVNEKTTINSSKDRLVPYHSPAAAHVGHNALRLESLLAG